MLLSKRGNGTSIYFYIKKKTQPYKKLRLPNICRIAKMISIANLFLNHSHKLIVVSCLGEEIDTLINSIVSLHAIEAFTKAMGSSEAEI